MYVRHLYLAAVLLFSCSFAALSADKPTPPAGTEGTSVVQEQLDTLERQLVELGGRESQARQRWITAQRKAMQSQRDLLKNDEEVKALQEKISAKLEEVRVLQAELDQLFADRLTAQQPAGVTNAPSAQAELQKEIVALGKQRMDLIRERDRLKRQLQADDAAPLQEGAP